MDIISKKTNAKMFPKCNFHVLSEPQSQKPHAEQIQKIKYLQESMPLMFREITFGDLDK